MDEESYLRSYRKEDYDLPLVSVDSVLFTYFSGALLVLLVQRGEHPDLGHWSLPGGYVDQSLDSDLESAARRKLREKTGVDVPYLEQLGAYGNQSRDKRGWSVTVAYAALVAHQDCQPGIQSVSDTRWFSCDEAATLELAFDHAHLLEAARERMRQKALYSVLPGYALPEEFTLPELQRLHEILVGGALTTKSFRRRIEQAGLLEETGRKRREGARPAMLYRLKDRSREHTFVRNLEP